MKAPIQGHESREFNRMYKEVDELYHEVALKSGLSDTSFLVLFSIVELGDGCLQIDIANRYFISKQTISSSVRALEQKGYLYLKHGKKRDMNLLSYCRGRTVCGRLHHPINGTGEQRVLINEPGGARRTSASDP